MDKAACVETHMNYDKIKWDARTNWEFCGNYRNLQVLWNHYLEYAGSDETLTVLGNRWDSIAEFSFGKVSPYFAYGKGEIITYDDNGQSRLLVVTGHGRGNNGAMLYARAANGTRYAFPEDYVKDIRPAEIPPELMALAKSEARRDDL